MIGLLVGVAAVALVIFVAVPGLWAASKIIRIQDFWIEMIADWQGRDRRSKQPPIGYRRAGDPGWPPGTKK